MSSCCMVCDASAAQYHFGATVCRACAAFFRRYVNTKKATIVCNCHAKRESQYPCRLCRMKKCISGKTEIIEEVQGPRDINSQSSSRKRPMLEGSSSSPFSSSPSSSPDLPPLRIDIKLRNMDRILNTSKNYGDLEMTRKTIFKRNTRDEATGEVNLYELSMEIKTDAKLLWRFCEMAFPEFDELNRHDKKILFYNFHTKWSVVEMVISAVKFNDVLRFFSPSGAPNVSIEKFYENRVNEKHSLSEEEVLRIFKPYWTYHFQNIIQPLAKMKFSNLEYMALFGILLWDAGYVNVSDSLAETCRAMRTIICRELKVHFEERSCPETRFFETLDTLNLVERAEKKCQEEIQMCGMYDVEMDEHMRNLIMWDKY